MDSEPFYPHIVVEYYRGIERGKIDKSRNPWAVKFAAFRRKLNEADGPTVLPSAHLCYRLDIVSVARIAVGSVNEVRNPSNRQPLTVIQDDAQHAYIANVPRFGADSVKDVEDCATELAEAAELLTEDECEAAKRQL